MNGAVTRIYPPVEGHFDEMQSASGALRDPWARLLDGMGALGHEELVRRREEAQRLISENGVTYNVYGDPRGIHRPWQLDALPMLIAPDEWASIERAVTQRARLLNAMLADLYGGRRLLREGLLPPELVYAHPGYLRPCVGLKVPGDVYLHVYAADIARSPDGQWWVISDRTQTPSGAGYALENRVVMSRTLPELFQQFHVQRLAGYFQRYRETLERLAPGRDGSPRIVLLTPGPYNETYFEHAYLARYLGVTLVEGADLTVRSERVYLKTLSGLLPVDVILRRQDDWFCDPLALYGESARGVAGLVQAVRAGNVAVANALGSGFLETAAVMAFLPGLSRTLLGEELELPSLATWWCGQEPERRYVEDNLAHLVLKPALPDPNREIVFGSELDATALEKLTAEIRARPDRYVAQEQVALSTVPIGGSEGLSPRHLVLRVYAVAHGDSYALMPGGLTRVSPSSTSLVVSSQRGGVSKDTWVLADHPMPYVSQMDRVSRPIDVSRGSYVLTSRVADNLFWLGRMSERLEAGVRSFRCAMRRISDDPARDTGTAEPDAVLLLERLARLDTPEDETAERPPLDETSPSVEERVLDALFDGERVGSPRSDAMQVHRLAWLVRDRISTDAWRVLSGLEHEFVDPPQQASMRLNQALRLLDETLMRLSAFAGLVLEGMTRGLGWRFLDLGRRVERSLQIVALLREGASEELPRATRRLENVLEIADGAMTYRSRYLTSVQPNLVVDLLLFDEANPRSLAYQLMRMRERLAGLSNAPIDQVDALVQTLREAPLEAIMTLAPRDPEPPHRPGLEVLLDEFDEAIPALADILNLNYLSHAVPRRQPSTFGGGTA